MEANKMTNAIKKLRNSFKRNSSSNSLRHVISANSLEIRNAWNEDKIVSLTIGDKKDATIENPHEITSVEAMKAASEEICDIVAKKGTISALESAAIIQQKMKVLHALWQHFPGAMSSEATLEGFKKVVERRGYTDDNTLFAQSICPDEINHEEGDITDLFTKYCGEVFHMGGLAGIPFTGKVGFGAFSHHVPDGGHCAVLMAPHIGIDEEGNFGAYSRDGQSHAGSCCGAAVGAYVHCRSGKDLPDLAVDPEFYQFNYIINQVGQNMCQVIGETENEKQSSLARLVHKIGSNMLEKCISVDFGDEKSTLVVLSGIQINMPRPFEDFFLPLQFFIMKKDGTREDVFEEAFGSRRNYFHPHYSQYVDDAMAQEQKCGDDSDSAVGLDLSNSDFESETVVGTSLSSGSFSDIEAFRDFSWESGIPKE